MSKHLLRSILLLMLAFPSLSVWASVPASGTFTATKACQAYQSMRKRTNPDNTVIDVGRSYSVSEVNVPEGTTWFRIGVEGANPEQRWVYHACGRADVTTDSGSGGAHSSGGDCNTAGEEESYVFALSWQPAFCEGHPEKPECKVTDPDAYQAKNFTLHGLWPNKESCGTHYGFCGKYKKPQRPFCNFDPVPMSSETLSALGVVMPSAASGSCLQRHEWYKHGTCQTAWDADGYFDEAMRLLAEFNGKGMARLMQANIGERVSTAALFAAIDSLFGDDAHKRMQFNCRNGNLVDIYINLPAKLQGQSLGQLIQQAEPKFSNRCSSSFIVDPIGQ